MSDLRNDLEPDAPARLDLVGVTVTYNGQAALCDCTFQVAHGGRVAVVGPNGAGKSTLFKALVGLLPLAAGRILIHGRPLGHHRDCVAYVPQTEEVNWGFPLTVADVVMMGRYSRIGWLRRPGKSDHKVVRGALDTMGIADLAARSVGELSGGQQQRVFLARALAQEPHILLMDEPFTGVDVTTRQAILDVLDQLRQGEVTTLISTHDLSLAASRFDQVLVLNRQVVAYGEPDKALTAASLRAAFGGQLLELGQGSVAVDQCCPPATAAPEGGRH